LNQLEIFRAKDISEQGEFWKVLHTTGKSQVAVMVLEDGKTSSEYGTDHPQADQLLYCVSGSGTLKSEGHEETFSEGDLALIPAGAKHQVLGGPCVTLNFYGPPAYPDE
jgi:quercetin dioxygenase-like cupin family protein